MLSTCLGRFLGIAAEDYRDYRDTQVPSGLATMTAQGLGLGFS
jgi:hypothetical protein